MKWTKVTEEMPPLKEAGSDDFKYLTSGKLLVFDNNTDIIIGMYEKGCGQDENDNWENWIIADEDDVYILDSVTHWTPLPSPPID